MRSRASFKGHPIHPMLIPFPFAFLWGAVGFDIMGTLLERPAFWTTAGYLMVAGVVAALVAAVPGVVDYVATVPPRSSGKKRATKHMLVNSAAVVLFVIAYLMRGDATMAPPLLALLLSAAGAVLLGMGGWMGGTLTFRNQIGVDHRFADAGKWNEAHVQRGSEPSVVVATATELEVNQMKLVHLAGEGLPTRRIVVGRTESGYVAFDDRCTHRGASLAGGAMICGTVQCPWHGSQFDTQSGEVKAGPADEKIESFVVEERGGQVRLSLP